MSVSVSRHSQNLFDIPYCRRTSTNVKAYLTVDALICCPLEVAESKGIDFAGAGLELLRDLRQRGQQTPVIVFTSSGSEDLAVEAMRLGAADYIVKSARGIAELPARISEVLHQTAG